MKLRTAAGGVVAGVGAVAVANAVLSRRAPPLEPALSGEQHTYRWRGIDVRYAEEIRQLLRNDANALLKEELDRRGGAAALAEAVADRETDPYAVADEIFEPLRDCVEARREE